MKRSAFAILIAATLWLPVAAQALTVAPPSFPDLVANPGDTLARVLHVRNDAASEARVHAEVVNFAGVAGDETSGMPDFYPASETRSGRELASWVRLTTEDLVLPAGASADIGYEIRVPADAAPGSRFGAVMLTMTAPDADGLTLATRTATLLLLRVNGDIREDAKLLSFEVDHSFSESLPLAFTARVENAGTVHVAPVGTVTIRNLFGGTTATLDMNRLEYKSILPGGIRRFTSVWQRDDGPFHSRLDASFRNLAFGRYTAEVQFLYGDRKTLSATTSFWVLPWKLLAAAACLLLVLILCLKWLMARHRTRVIADYEATRKDRP